MPRVILRTVEPAKVLACQSDDSRCTWWNARPTMSCIIFSVSAMMFMKMAWRSKVAPTPSAISSQKAPSAALRATVSAGAPPATASISRPTYRGVRMSASAESSASMAMRPMRQGCLAQCLKVKPRTALNADPRKSSLLRAICQGPATRRAPGRQ